MPPPSITYNLNDMVFIENIGYGVLMDCGDLKKLTVKEEEPLPVNQKKQSIYFDPDLFNSESEAFIRKKSEAATLVTSSKIDMISKFQSPQKIKSYESVNPDDNKSNKSQKTEMINIVKVRLQGGQALVYTPDRNIRKHVIIPVRILFLPAIGTINIRIQINKTIQSFKREVFDLLGLKYAHYFNVKFFTTSPTLAELNSNSKTIWQYGIKQSSILTMVAEHGFCFQSVPNNLLQSFGTVNHNLTFVSLPKKQKAQTQVIPLPPPSLEQPPAEAQKQQAQKSPQKQQKVQNPKKQQKPKEQNQVKQQSPQKVPNSPVIHPKDASVSPTKLQLDPTLSPKKQSFSPPEILYLQADKKIYSGKHYFEVRLDKLPLILKHFQIVLTNGNNRYSFQPLIMHKIHTQNQQVIEKDQYGAPLKATDNIGVFIKVSKQKNLKVGFYKNSVSLGLCWEFKILEVGIQFGMGSEGQITLDTRIPPPVDSYRF